MRGTMPATLCAFTCDLRHYLFSNVHFVPLAGEPRPADGLSPPPPSPPPLPAEDAARCVRCVPRLFHIADQSKRKVHPPEQACSPRPRPSKMPEVRDEA